MCLLSEFKQRPTRFYCLRTSIYSRETPMKNRASPASTKRNDTKECISRLKNELIIYSTTKSSYSSIVDRSRYFYPCIALSTFPFCSSMLIDDQVLNFHSFVSRPLNRHHVRYYEVPFSAKKLCFWSFDDDVWCKRTNSAS